MPLEWATPLCEGFVVQGRRAVTTARLNAELIRYNQSKDTFAEDNEASAKGKNPYGT